MLYLCYRFFFICCQPAARWVKPEGTVEFSRRCTAPCGERAYESCAAHRQLLGQPPAADAVAAASAPPLLQPLAHLSPAPGAEGCRHLASRHLPPEQGGASRTAPPVPGGRRQPSPSPVTAPRAGAGRLDSGHRAAERRAGAQARLLARDRTGGHRRRAQARGGEFVAARRHQPARRPVPIYSSRGSYSCRRSSPTTAPTTRPSSS